MRKAVPSCFVLKRKEIENYLLDLKAISSAFSTMAARRKVSFPNKFSSSEKYIANVVKRATNQFKSHVAGQLAEASVYSGSKSSKYAPATLIKKAVEEFDGNWKKLDYRLRVSPGKDVLSSINTILQKETKVSLTKNLIVRHMHRDNVPSDLVEILEYLDAFCRVR